MAWIIFCLLIWTAAIIIIPKRQWQRLWPAGIVAIIVMYLLDTTLVGLQAYSFKGSPINLQGVPLFYFASAMPLGIILVNFGPQKRWVKVVYLLLIDALFLTAELIMNITGNFSYLNWSPDKSLLLNLLGFIVIIWISELIIIKN